MPWFARDAGLQGVVLCPDMPGIVGARVSHSEIGGEKKEEENTDYDLF